MSIASGHQTTVILFPVGQGTTSAQPGATVHKSAIELRAEQHTAYELNHTEMPSMSSHKLFQCIAGGRDRQTPYQGASCPVLGSARPLSIQDHSIPLQMRLALASCPDCRTSGTSE